jgi:hypothetical protein
MNSISKNNLIRLQEGYHGGGKQQMIESTAEEFKKLVEYTDRQVCSTQKRRGRNNIRESGWRRQI